MFQGVGMKRKVIQIADSTQLVSLPRKWAKLHNIKKGEELDVEICGNKVIVSTGKEIEQEPSNLNAKNLYPMIRRSIHALYKKGVDEIRVEFDEKTSHYVQSALGKEAVGFEIVDQSPISCTIRHVGGELDDFDSILRRTFLLLINMAEETHNAIKKGDFVALRNTMFLEESNNRFTTGCRRLINKKKNEPLMGPLYYIVEELENIADYYKYLCAYFYDKRDEIKKVSPDVLKMFEKVIEMTRLFYETYYKFDQNKIRKIGELRKHNLKKGMELMEKKLKPYEHMLLHDLLTINQKVFCLVGPYLVMKL